MTYEKIVEKVNKAYANADLSNIKEHIAIQFNVTGNGEGAFYLEVSNGKANVQPYEYYDRDALVTIAAEDLIKIVEGKLDPIKAYETGKINVEGDAGKLASVIVKVTEQVVDNADKPVAKKSTAKGVVTKVQFVEAVAEKAGISKTDAAAVVNAYAEVVAEELSKGEKIQLAGFGTFETGKRAARTGRNPLTGETIEISASTTLKFKAGKALKDALN